MPIKDKSKTLLYYLTPIALVKSIYDSLFTKKLVINGNGEFITESNETLLSIKYKFFISFITMLISLIGLYFFYIKSTDNTHSIITILLLGFLFASTLSMLSHRKNIKGLKDPRNKAILDKIHLKQSSELTETEKSLFLFKTKSVSYFYFIFLFFSLSIAASPRNLSILFNPKEESTDIVFGSIAVTISLSLILLFKGFLSLKDYYNLKRQGANLNIIGFKTLSYNIRLIFIPIIIAMTSSYILHYCYTFIYAFQLNAFILLLTDLIYFGYLLCLSITIFRSADNMCSFETASSPAHLNPFSILIFIPMRLPKPDKNDIYQPPIPFSAIFMCILIFSFLIAINVSLVGKIVCATCIIYASLLLSIDFFNLEKRVKRHA